MTEIKRLYPFDFNSSGIFSDLACGCPVELLYSGETVRQSLGLDSLKAAAWHHMLYSEIRLEKKDYEYWTHIRFTV